MKKYKIASGLMLIHGALMEIGGCLCLIPVLIAGGETSGIGRYFSFIVPYFQENLGLMLVMGAVYGTARVIGAVGLWKNRMWGFALSAVNCVVTLNLAMFMLPAGIMDGLFAGAALILMLMEYFGNKRVLDSEMGMRMRGPRNP